MSSVDYKLAGSYKLTRNLGRGSFAEVYKGIHVVNGNVFAVKRIYRSKLKTPKLVDHLMSEVAIMRDHQHLNIVRLFEKFETETSIYLVMEYCSGRDLSKYLRPSKNGPSVRLDESSAVRFLLQLAEGLQFLHSLNIIHRDIKPQNVLLSDTSDHPVLKLADFGFAKILSDAEAMAVTNCGTPLYM